MPLFQKRNNRINRPFGDTNVEFLPPSSEVKEKTRANLFTAFYRLERPILEARFYEVLMFFILAIAILLSRVFYITIINGADYQNLYELIHQKTEWILAPRGLITDRNGTVLAYNAPSEKPNEFRRFYPDAPFFSHIIGYIGRVSEFELGRDAAYLPADFAGKTGIEQAYETYLRGIHGRIDKPIRATGQILQEPVVTPPKAGNTLTLTIDAAMQKALTTFLYEKMKEVKSPGAAAVVLNPLDGSILSLISLPNFDNNAITQSLLIDSSWPLFNRAIAGEYPPGSAIKPFMASAALKENIIAPLTIVHDGGSISIPSMYDPAVSWTFRSWRALGPVDMRRALALSSNIYFYTVGGGYKDIKGLGIKRMNQYLTEFGFNSVPPIDIPGATKGFLPSPEWKKDTYNEPWSLGDTYNSAIGQGFTRVTPLQLALATASIANNGAMYTPHVLQNITDEKGKTIVAYTPSVLANIPIEQESLQIVKEGMEMAVTEGTVKRLASLPITIAAKTGTAQEKKGKNPHAWVTLFAPYENPEIVVTILIENGIGGEQSAVPVAKNFLEWYVQQQKS